MAVFRANDDLDPDNDGEPEEDENTKSEDPSDNNQAEKDNLNHQRRRFDKGTIDYGHNNSSSNEQKALRALETDQESKPVFENPPQKEASSSSAASSSASTKPPRRNLARRLLKAKPSKNKKKIWAAAGFFIGPSLIVLIIFLIIQGSGLPLEHIQRVSTGLRFGAMHTALSKRYNHLRHEFVRLSDYGVAGSTRPANYVPTTLTSRLLGTTPAKIYDHLYDKGYRFKYTTFKGGSVFTKGKSTLTEITAPDGEVREIRSSREALNFIDEAGDEFDDLLVTRFRGARAQMLLAEQINIPFLRFKTLINGLKNGSFRNAIRGSPVEFVEQRVNEEIFQGKTRISNKLTGIRQTLSKYGDNVDALIENTQADSVKGLAKENILEKLREPFNGRQGAMAITAAAGISIAITTFACVLREIGTMIREAFQMRVRGLQDNAATVITTTSQMKAGDMAPEIVSDMTRRFDGFPNSANYKAGVQDQPVEQYAGVEGVDFSETFSADNIFDGFAMTSLYVFSSLFSVKAVYSFLISHIQTWASYFNPAIGQIVGFAINVFGGHLEFAINTVEKLIAKACRALLNPKVQIIITGFEIVAMVVVAIFTAGLGGVAGGGVKATTGSVIGQITKQLLSKRFLLLLGASVTLDVLLYDYLLPNMIMNASGAGTALNGDSGAENHASFDYGMHYLAMSEGLNRGGSSIPVNEAVTQTQNYLAQQRNHYADQGIFSNLFSFDNPHSLASSIMVAQNHGGSWQETGQAYVAGIFSNLGSRLDFFQPVYAQEQNDQLLAKILYPGQTHVVGFFENEVSGESQLFAHEENAIYVENHLDDLKEKYSGCLNPDISGFMLTQLGITTNNYGHEYYPKECDYEDARRYKTYYQDCTLIENIRLWKTNSSPMFSSTCDNLLSQENQDILNESASSSQTKNDETDLELAETIDLSDLDLTLTPAEPGGSRLPTIIEMPINPSYSLIGLSFI